MYQRKAVAEAAKVGPAEPGQAFVQVHFGGKIILILLKSVADVTIQGDGRNQPLKQ